MAKCKVCGQEIKNKNEQLYGVLMFGNKTDSASVRVCRECIDKLPKDWKEMLNNKR